MKAQTATWPWKRKC